MQDTTQGQNGAGETGDIVRKIPFETAGKLLEALYIRAEGSMGARDDLDKIKELLLT